MNKINTSNMNYIVNRRLNESIISKKRSDTETAVSFESALGYAKSEAEVKFSKHALDRMGTRNIYLKDVEIEKIGTAIQKASAKGVKDALILMGDVAFIANIRSKTIITTATSEQLKENVFTNIDGAVII